MIYDQFLLIIESQTISDAVNFFEAFKILEKDTKLFIDQPLNWIFKV